uniref:Uncharacterized protein n=1 Tax=Anguilla anguilla TaxID=7936 RepID=A0A0E9TMJ4_ANGAN
MRCETVVQWISIDSLLLLSQPIRAGCV